MVESRSYKTIAAQVNRKADFVLLSSPCCVQNLETDGAGIIVQNQGQFNILDASLHHGAIISILTNMCIFLDGSASWNTYSCPLTL